MNYEIKKVADWWVCTDIHTGIMIGWQNGRFNDTQNVQVPEGYEGGAMQLATVMREMGDWLAVNHREKVIAPVRGGRRDGSGRKRLGSEKRVTLNARVDPATLSELQRRAHDEGKSVGAVIDDLTQR